MLAHTDICGCCEGTCILPDWAHAVCDGLLAQAHAVAWAESPALCIKEEEDFTWGWASGAVPLPAIGGSAAASAMKYLPSAGVGFSLQ